jgi:GT2 family glycosyltransferase
MFQPMVANSSPASSLLDAITRREFGLALFIASGNCQSLPSCADAILQFRQIYQSIARSENRKNLAEFHDSVGVPVPRTVKLRSPKLSPALTSKVDIVIPVHNGRMHLEACLASLRRFSSKYVEKVVIVDDGSDPYTSDFVQKYCSEDSTYVSLRIDRSVGFTRALVAGLRLSDSPSFIALNSDTIVCEGWVEKLLATACSAPNVAIVGPVSNAAAWQNVAEPLDDAGNFIRHKLIVESDFANLQSCITFAQDGKIPESPLIHGFCVLVNRDAYEEIGRLDETYFPRGYGEFQDLSIRFWDAGYLGKIATDCFVAHAGAGSLDLERRAQLSVAGRVKMYNKHTALRYLTFEAASIYSLPMSKFRQRFARRFQR